MRRRNRGIETMRNRIISSLIGVSFLLWMVGCTQEKAPTAVSDGDTATEASGDTSDTNPEDSSDTAGRDPDGTDDSDTLHPCLGENPPDDCQMVPSGPACGDGEINQDWEECDDGNTLPGDGCSGMCRIEAHYACPTPGEPCVFQLVCGNGIREPGESCDEGEHETGGCIDCQRVHPDFICPTAGEPCVRVVFCGDGRVEGGETCDEGDHPTEGCVDCQVQPGWVCRFPGQSCVTAPYCGDGIIQFDRGEACDDGNAVGGDGCAANCMYVEAGYTCPTPGQSCVPSMAVCGDGRVEGTEECDDGNTRSNDGCSSTCTVEYGYHCPFPGAPCMTHCGDGIVMGTEQCDDGNNTDGDGCASDCQWEEEMRCRVVGTGPPMEYQCVSHVCGDGPIPDGWFSSIPCDDGNLVLGDGCTPFCEIEPSCTVSNGCTARCGDGIVMGAEQCDDGNLMNGDGCSSTCQVEPGFTCTQPAQDILEIPVIYRDFTANHVDFGLPRYPDTSCDTGASPATGMVQNLLGSNGKPVQASPPTLACASRIGDWYNDTAARVVVADRIRLFPDGNGNFVNRYGQNGEHWTGPSVISKCADGPNIIDGSYMMNMCVNCATLTDPQQIQQCNNVAAALSANPGYTCASPCPHDYSNRTCLVGPAPTCDMCSGYGTTGFTCINPCGSHGNGYTTYDLCQSSAQLYDGNPLFFPIDHLGTSSDLGEGKIPEQYGYNGWPWEYEVTGVRVNHNFYFTSEVMFWFQYDATQVATLHFTGDDDVWVFVNGRLAVDLGGPHVPLHGSVSIHSGTAATYGLTDGNVYRINIFHAERKMEGSSFRLTLAGFSTSPSVCVPTCGDGVVTMGEQCDDGTNVGGYGNCQPDCTLGPRCGDGIRQSAHEECDNGVNLDSYGASGGTACAPNCMLPPRCGDALVQNLFGETCDDGINDGSYGGCTPTCQIGPFCGDGIAQASFGEDCDDGVNDGTYGKCAPGCVLGPRCGDGVIQEEWGEECDGDNVPDGYTCGPNCKLLGICGDAFVDTAAGEQCDDGFNLGGYGECAPGCVHGPHCGDGIRQAAHEQCDDGTNAGGYGECAPGCVLGPHCGDGIVQPAYEDCDLGEDNGPGGTCSTACRFNIPIT
jgi:fibro-slime domain-containing protein